MITNAISLIYKIVNYYINNEINIFRKLLLTKSLLSYNRVANNAEHDSSRCYYTSLDMVFVDN